MPQLCMAARKCCRCSFRPSNPQLDLTVVVVSAVVLVAESANWRFLKGLRVLRATRPLRVLTRSQSMLMVFHTLVRSLAEMANATGAGAWHRCLSVCRKALLAAAAWHARGAAMQPVSSLC